ncbi:MAG TPA: undecaprenyldiphospho-muramoylpentapeptide beta-N-acetylglucosaminyltransferase [Myxococcota bacterium]|nr:undecaprenyldiphospho-muramoylpentapeptide beta-N-acetylglucosaminyltransferase [Myxococcota bacterium]HNZ02943.1 undecaprenyldiphospho-muramoylpentapeptide beta-N-acetylglucosaminyltransferase [Myxococcota bacterium]HOD07175.1 undecaprenyldiphospho-muramoylpentapeptide beta-N-acetylglucosaminyltransferase [Myxococcota bacterium]HPB49999.1 undecaprenyldiphospho-muramoylpentapeptide beta-N-acetylglucosaminyltransferase [Myxococcota bacterium]HQP94999.1 undecaprenyldiphospho-muramoylpentapepti
MTSRNQDKRIRVALVAAQTGGHLLPAVETARVLVSRGCEVTLVSSGAAVEKTILADAGIPVMTLAVGQIKGMGIARKLRGLLSIPGALFRAARMVRGLRVDAVAGFGGYTAGPFVLAAAMTGVPTAIYEGNSRPGLTNRLLAKVARKVFVNFVSAIPALGRKDAEITGNPVRKSILHMNRAAGVGMKRRILVLGGSQGSRFLNERMPPVFAAMADVPGGLAIRHQCGLGNQASVSASYRELGVEAEVSDYIRDMADAYSSTDFIICRAGAGTVSEVAVAGLPALYVPFAAATDDHQAANAADMVTAGAAMMIRESEFDTGKVAGLVTEVLSDPVRLSAMSSAALAAARPDAADRIAEGILGMVGK